MPGKKVLIVEDDDMLRDLYVGLLKREQLMVDQAIDGEEALAKMSQGGYDLVLLDIMLPKRDGLDVLKTLKQTPPLLPNGQIVLLTNLGLDPVIKDGFANGASGYLLKASLTPEKVIQEVKNFLNKKPQAGEQPQG